MEYLEHNKIGDNMKITNKHSLPEIYEEAIRIRFEQNKIRRDKPSIGITRLIDSPYIYHLRDIHDDEIEMDVIDAFFAFRGSMVHQILEDVRIPNVQKEAYIQYQHKSGYLISGVIDLITPSELVDYKVKSVNSMFYFNSFDALNNEQQLNCYAYLFEKVWSFFPCKKLLIRRIFFDWVAKKAKYESGYPQSPFKEYECERWTKDKTENYIDERMELHLRTSNIPICSPEERWQKKTVWALMKDGQKRAVKIFQNQDDIPNVEKSYYIEERKGIDVRCVDYCNVNQWCEYYKDTYGG